MNQVAITLLVFTQQNQVIIPVRFGVHLVALLRDIDLAADHRMHALFLGPVVELHGAEQVAVIRHGHGGHLLLDHEIHQLVDFASPVEQGIIGVAMQMDERCWSGHSVSNTGGRAYL